MVNMLRSTFESDLQTFLITMRSVIILCCIGVCVCVCVHVCVHAHYSSLSVRILTGSTYTASEQGVCSKALLLLAFHCSVSSTSHYRPYRNWSYLSAQHVLNSCSR